MRGSLAQPPTVWHDRGQDDCAPRPVVFRMSGVTPMAHIDPHEPVCVFCGHDCIPPCPTCPTCGCAQREAS